MGTILTTVVGATLSLLILFYSALLLIDYSKTFEPGVRGTDRAPVTSPYPRPNPFY